MKNIISIIDTFTLKEFSGNPAAVYHMIEERSTDWMQSFAAEINLSETIYETQWLQDYYNNHQAAVPSA